MAQDDYVIADQAGVAFLNDLNNQFAATVTNNSGPTEPTVKYAHMWWPDTTNGLMKQRNTDNDAWIIRGPLNSSAKSGLKNLIINGKFQINQRGAVSKTATSGAYNYDRWYFDGTDLRYRVEDGDYVPSTVYTLSGTNVTTTQITSPSSGVWTLTVPTTVNLVQLELGSVATDFEHRSYGEELALCQRYFCKFTGYISVTLQNSTLWPVQMRSTPTVTSTATGFTIFSNNIYGGSLIATANSASAVTSADAEL